MLTELTSKQARFIALLAETARVQRDRFLVNVAEEELGGSEPARGEHNPAAELGYEPLALDSEQMTALREAIASLSSAARIELYTLMRIGQGDLAAQDWHGGVSEGGLLGEPAIIAALIEDADLHDHLLKGLYEAEAA